tara:strand:- start:601 stop:882 length:282 start_codon:yes stop_codon:yes gene_type:complete
MGRPPPWLVRAVSCVDYALEAGHIDEAEHTSITSILGGISEGRRLMVQLTAERDALRVWRLRVLDLVRQMACDVEAIGGADAFDPDETGVSHG